MPPSEAQVLPVAAVQRRPGAFVESLPFGLAELAIPATQDGYPPPFFKRLDKYIKDNGFRAHDVFMAIDRDQNRCLTVDEMLSGFSRIEFHLSKKEERMLREWMAQVVGHDLSFKEFTLALKQRASLTSPQRISILKLQAQQ
jgi:hypothetical protein